MTTDEQHQASQLRGKNAKSEGNWFEALMEQRLKAMEMTGLVAHWAHNEPLFRMVGGTKDARGAWKPRFSPCGAGIADYTGMLAGGLYFAIEAKSTKEARLPLDRISEKQQDHLDDIARAGGLAFLAVQDRSVSPARDFLIPWRQVPWEVARSARTVKLAELGEFEAPRCNLGSYLDRWIWRCEGCGCVYPAPRQHACSRLACEQKREPSFASQQK